MGPRVVLAISQGRPRTAAAPVREGARGAAAKVRCANCKGGPRVAKITLSREQCRDKVHACWLGKNIGGTLGAPVEGQKQKHQFTFYDPPPDRSAPNDDLDFQLVWLQMVRERGPNIRVADFVDYWKKHLSAYPWNEYGMCQRNMDRGLMPPIAGCFENYFVDEMGAPIRSEIWACLAPGDPQLAAAFAWKDAVVDHAGGEGMHGEMFWAAVESAAFVIDDPLALIRIGLGMIPLSSQVSRVVREVVWCWQNGVGWEDARESVLRAFGHNQPCHAVQTIGFTVIGWLYGRDYGDKLCTAVNCGYDTDCSGATLGSLLGILGGTAAIPRQWLDPVGEEIVLHKYTRNLDVPRTVGELTDRTLEAAEVFLKAHSDVVSLGRRARIPADAVSLLSRNERALAASARDIQAATVPAGDNVEITLHYGGEPVLWPGVAKALGVTLERSGKPVRGSVELLCTGGWQVKKAKPARGQVGFAVLAAEVDPRNSVMVRATVAGQQCAANFVLLGPEEAKGYPAPENVAGCPVCHGRLGSCICVQG